MENNQSNTTDKPKKKPGRPRIAKPKKVVLVNGVVDKPNDVNHIMEFTYPYPTDFKRIFNMLSHYYVEIVVIEFGMNFVSIKSKDHTKQTTISVQIDCNKISEYYCKQPFTMCVKCEYLVKLFGTCTSEHCRFVIASNENDYQSCLEICLVNDTASIHDSYIIETSLSEKPHNEQIDMIGINNYLMRCTICSKNFKRFIYDSLSNKILTIEKHNQTYLKFKTTYNNKLSCTRTFRNEHDIDLGSNLNTREYFNVDLNIERIQPFSDINISKHVNMYINTQDVVFEKHIGDSAITVRIHTQCINYMTR